MRATLRHRSSIIRLRYVERLKRLQEATKTAFDTMVIKNAQRLYEALFEEVEAGSEIMVEPDKETVPLMIFSA